MKHSPTHDRFRGSGVLPPMYWGAAATLESRAEYRRRLERLEAIRSEVVQLRSA